MADVCLLVLFLSSSSPDTLVDLYYNVNANNGLLQNAIVGVQLGEKKGPCSFLSDTYLYAVEQSLRFQNTIWV